MAIQITGDKELDRFFRTLTPSLQRGTLRKGVRAGSGAFTKHAKQHLDRFTQRRTGNLRKSLGFIRQANNPATGDIGALTGARRGKHKGFHAHLVEFGHNITKTKGGPSLGRVRPRPFFRTAMRSSRQDVLQAIRVKLAADLQKRRAR